MSAATAQGTVNRESWMGGQPSSSLVCMRCDVDDPSPTMAKMFKKRGNGITIVVPDQGVPDQGVIL